MGIKTLSRLDIPGLEKTEKNKNTKNLSLEKLVTKRAGKFGNLLQRTNTNAVKTQTLPYSLQN